MIAKPSTLYVVVPCYNEEPVLPETTARLLALFESMRNERLIDSLSRIVYVDDGSSDATWDMINQYSTEYEEVYGIKLAKNVGHQNALLAGLMTVKDSCECVVSMDADLQDDIEAMREMVMKFRDGNEIVYGVRTNRDTDTAFKRKTAHGFYKLMKLLGVNMVSDHADYRLMSSKALNALSSYDEVNLFLRGIVPLLGFKHDFVGYTRGERFAGTSKYPLNKMIAFATEAITSFSSTPLRIIGTIGIFACMIAVVVALYTLIQKFTGHTDAGWASIMISIWFIGGVQLISLGILGEYIGKTYKEVKRRPRYNIEEVRF